MTDARDFDEESNVVPFVGPEHGRHEQPGYFSLADVPQRPDVSGITKSTGWDDLDEIFKPYPGQFVVVTGLPGSGKSTFVLNLLINMAIKHGTRSFLYVPENEPFLASKMRRIWKGRQKDDSGFAHFAEYQCFVQSAQPNAFDQAPQDLHWVLTKAVTAIEEDGVDVLLIDPWNELEHAKSAKVMMADYIRECLMWLKQFCRRFNVTVFLVAHPTKAVAEHGGRAPTLSDIEGSMNWYNKCDNGLIAVRDHTNNSTKIISAKVREQGSGKIGACHFYVDKESERFIPMTGASYGADTIT